MTVSPRVLAPCQYLAISWIFRAIIWVESFKSSPVATVSSTQYTYQSTVPLRSVDSGDVVYLKVLGQSIVILSSYEAAYEVMERRSANYSDRPQSAMVNL